VSAVALERQLNANLLRKWVKDARNSPVPALPRVVADAAVVKSLPAFVPVKVEARDEPPREDRPIRVHIRKGRSRITIEWPASAAGSCAGWLRELIG
jgi:transposase